MLGIRILLAIPGEAEYAQDYEIIWSYEAPIPVTERDLPSLAKGLASNQDLWKEVISLLKTLEGPNAANVFQQKVLELSEFDTEYIVQVKDATGVWRTHSY